MGRFVAVAGVESAPLEDGRVVLFHASSGKFVLLNHSATVLWSALAVPRTRAELVTALTEAFQDASLATAELDAQAALLQLQELDFLAPLAEGGDADAEPVTASRN